MNVTIQGQDNITPTLEQMAENFPRDFWRGMHSASKWAVKRIRSNFIAEQTANAKLAPLAELTKTLRSSRVNRLSANKRQLAERRTALGWVRFNRVLKSGKMSKRTQRMRVQAGFAPKKALSEALNTAKRSLADATALGGRMQRLFEYQINEANWMVRIGWLGESFAKSQVSGAEFQKSQNRAFTTNERHWLHRSLRSKIIQSQYQKPLRSTIAPYQIDPETNAQFRDVVWKTIQNLSKWRASKGLAQVNQ